MFTYKIIMFFLVWCERSAKFMAYKIPSWYTYPTFTNIGWGNYFQQIDFQPFTCEVKLYLWKWKSLVTQKPNKIHKLYFWTYFVLKSVTCYHDSFILQTTLLCSNEWLWFLLIWNFFSFLWSAKLARGGASCIYLILGRPL